MATRTIDNCMIRKKYECDTVDSRCEGIQRSEWDDEPAPPCDTGNTAIPNITPLTSIVCMAQNMILTF